MRPARRAALAVALAVLTVLAVPAPAIGVTAPSGGAGSAGDAAAGPVAAVPGPTAATGVPPGGPTAVDGAGGVGTAPAAPAAPTGTTRPEAAAASGGTVTWRLDSNADWGSGSFDNTSAVAGDLGLVPDPSPAWSNPVPGDAMMVDVNDAYNDTHLVYSVDEDAVYMANQSTGNVLWSSADGQDNLADVAKIGTAFVYSGNDGSIWMHDHDGNLAFNPTSSDVTSCCIESAAPDADPNGIVYIGDEDDSIEVFSKTNGSKIRDLTYAGDDGSALFVDPSGDHLYVHGTGDVFVFSGIPTSLNQEAQFSANTGDIDEYDSDAIYADERYLYFGSNGGSVRVVDKGNWSVVGDISATGADVWSVDADDRHIYYAAHDGFVYVHRKNRDEGFPLVARIDVGGGSWANSVDGDDERIVYGIDGGEVGSLVKYTRGGTYTNSNDFGETVVFRNVSVNASLTSSADLVVSSDVDDDGTFEDSTTVALSDGNNTYDLSGLANGTRVRIAVRFDAAPNMTSPEIHDLQVNAQVKEYFEVSIDGTNSPGLEGEPLNVTTTVTNTGAFTATQTLNLATRPLVGSTVDRDARTLTLASGETRTINLSWTPGPTQAGDYNATVAGANESDSTLVEVLNPAEFEVSIDGTNSPVTEGDTLRVNATVTNAGDVDDTQTVALSTGGAERDSTTVTLASGASTTIALEWTTTIGDAGTHTAAVASANGADATGVTVRRPDNGSGYFDVTIADATDPVTEGGTVRVNATVSNLGDGNATKTVTLLGGGARRDSVTVSLGPGGTTTVSLTWSTVVGDAGDHVVAVDTADGGDASVVSVQRTGNLGGTGTDRCRGDAPEGDDANDNGENDGCRG